MKDFRLSVLSILFALVLSTMADPSLYQKVVHNIDEEAVCLDGSPAAFYIHEGTQKDKFLIYLSAGGICEGLDPSQTLLSCYQRSLTQYGSSLPWPETLDLSGAEGYLSTDPSENDLFADWTKVLWIYCDGALHQGYAKDPYEVQGSNIYFRGSKIAKAHFKYLDDKYGLYKARQVVLTGASAGAVGAFVWTNYLFDRLKNPYGLTTILDSGILLSYPSMVWKVSIIDILGQNLFNVADADETLPK